MKYKLIGDLLLSDYKINIDTRGWKHSLRTAEEGAITQPAKERIVETVPDEEYSLKSREENNKVYFICKEKNSRFLLTHLSHPEGDFINLVDGHKRLHIIKEKDIVEDGGKQGQWAIKHCSGEDAIAAEPGAPAHSSVSGSLLQPFSVPSCNHLPAWPSEGNHIIIACKSTKLH